MSDQNECVVSIEEPCALRTDGRAASTSEDDQSTEIDNVSPDEADNMDVRIRNLKKLVEEENQEKTTDGPNQSARPPKIQKVPFILRDREGFHKCYEPRVVSIGPIHHKKPNLRFAEQYKPKLTAMFIKESKQETEALYNVINDRIQELKDCYHEDVVKDYDDKTLSWILFLDGCSILVFIHGFIHGKLKYFKIKTDHIAFTQHDLFLLENQIPFQVLRLLMDSTPPSFKTELKKSIAQFICANVMAPVAFKKYLSFDMDKLDPIHLLDLLQHVAVLSNKEKIAIINGSEHQTQQSFRNVQELKAAGIGLIPNKFCSLSDITFYSFCFKGWLELPPLIVDDSTAPKFLNLIAYEGCPDNFRTNYEITSYISFLDSLIDHANDVKELRSAKILHNLLGCDEEVASLFNEIARDLVPNDGHYKDVKIAIQLHYDSRWMTWIAEAYNDHFSSPWTILAFIAALVALALSGIQTWFGVFSPSDPCTNCSACTRK
ncbi:hypothetical protein L484_005828 [Morus notabilis]|uniref:Uncharacterized protein n=1 Tax=Morus notabilis TaxID=981085 RepID=W9RNP0_9ROSA|nr:UPF0481 protein At3g47200 [Morus notabilis]EXC00014.1 hypothetical protein L484_005828 [Morus notabilis]